jgi:hypothetical protein
VTQTKKAGDKGAGLLTQVQGLAPASPYQGEADASSSMRRVRVRIPNSPPLIFSSHPERSEGSRRPFQCLSSITHPTDEFLPNRLFPFPRRKGLGVRLLEPRPFLLCHPEPSEGSRRAFQRPASVTHPSLRPRRCHRHALDAFPDPHLYLSEERSARAACNAARDGRGSTPAHQRRLFLHSGNSGWVELNPQQTLASLSFRGVKPLPNPLLGQGEGTSRRWNWD